MDGSRMVVRFGNINGALKSATGEQLAGFTIAGADRKFVPATAEIRCDTVVVRSPAVTQPAAVRYAWVGWPAVSLFDTQGLPASPFRTDAWEK